MNSCFIHGYYSYCNCNVPRTSHSNPPGRLIYRLGSDCYQRPLPDDRCQVLWVSGGRYREEKARLGYSGPEDCPVDSVDYWHTEAQRGTYTCWIEIWHPYEAYAKDYDRYPDRGYWTNNTPIEEEPLV